VFRLSLKTSKTFILSRDGYIFYNFIKRDRAFSFLFKFKIKLIILLSAFFFQGATIQFILEQERQEAERKRVRAQEIADFQKIIAAGTTEDFLQWKAIEATENLATKLSDSPNTKFIIMGG